MTDQTPVPALAASFELAIERGAPLDLGALAIGGRRVHVPVLGGSAIGGLTGALVGGSETLLERGDGVTVIEASYYLLTANGTAARILGQGYATSDHTRVSLQVEAAADGALAAFPKAVFIAEALPGAATMTVMRVL